MKNVVRTMLLGGALAGGLFMTAAPAHAECYNYPPARFGDITLPNKPIICKGYNYCDAYICI
jgi:hypothetical protein